MPSLTVLRCGWWVFAGACSSDCKLTDNPNAFIFGMANLGGRVRLGIPPLGRAASWQIQVGHAHTHARSVAESALGALRAEKAAWHHEVRARTSADNVSSTQTCRWQPGTQPER